MRSTHTYARLEVSKPTYDEIAKKLRDAGYDHSFMGDPDTGDIDMHGLALCLEEPSDNVSEGNDNAGHQ